MGFVVTELTELYRFFTDLTGDGGGNKRVKWKYVEIGGNFPLIVLVEVFGSSPTGHRVEPRMADWEGGGTAGNRFFAR